MSHAHHFDVRNLEVPAVDKLADCPRFIRDSDTSNTKAILREAWNQWWKVDQPLILKQILAEAIAAKLIKPLKLKEPK